MEYSFFEKPILNSPYAEPTQHHDLDESGRPTGAAPHQGRRKSSLATPMVPASKNNKGKSEDSQGEFDLRKSQAGFVEDPTPIINEIRSQVSNWRRLPNPNSWGVTPITARLLQHWRRDDVDDIRPFFCQVEAVETVIWLTEVARKSARHKRFWTYIGDANEIANPGLFRMALKMATGSGKTTVMAMLIAWHTLNAVRSPNSNQFTRGFLIITPGITIRDRLRVLQPNDPDSYFQTRDLVPADLCQDLNKAKIVITNYHAFQLKDKIQIKKVTEAALQGRGEPINKKEEIGQMVQRVAGDILNIENLIIINDEAHHCYRKNPNASDEKRLSAEEKKEAKKNAEAAHMWLSGIEAVKETLKKQKKQSLSAIYDLSATPFFLQGSGWREGALFPWTVSDFSLIDAIECGIVKLPRIPISSNIPSNDMPVFRNLWEHIKKDMPKTGRAKGGQKNPSDLPLKLQTALNALYSHYEKTDDEWKRSGIKVPPVFIVVCNNTTTSELVYEWISGWKRQNKDGDLVVQDVGNLKLFSNFDQYGQDLPQPNTILVDSREIESGQISDAFKKIAENEIDKFRQERRQRGDHSEISDSELLREVMNTVGKEGRLGEQVRCVVSVSMLTEGWDTNNVTHILGVRAFGTQLLCEQVVGRGLRRYNYDLNQNGLFDSEYADIMGIPFNFTASAVPSSPQAPKKTTRVAAMKERTAKEIRFPRIIGYRAEFQERRLKAAFNDDSRLTLTPEIFGGGEVLLSGVVGEQNLISVADAKKVRPSTLPFNIASKLLHSYFRDENGEPRLYLFSNLKKIARLWLEGGYLECKGDTGKWMLEYPLIMDQACERIYNAILRAMTSVEEKPETKISGEALRTKSTIIEAVPDRFNPWGSTRHVGFSTTKELYATDADKSHVNYVTKDSGWEGEFARVVEQHPRTIAYVKNQGLAFEIPYRDGGVPRTYMPDFIVQIDDGHGLDDLLNIVIEVKGYRQENVKLKSETMREQWIPGVNNLKTFGRWAFGEFTSVFDFEVDFEKLLAQYLIKTMNQKPST